MTRMMRTARSITALASLASLATATCVALAPASIAAPLAGTSPANHGTTRSAHTTTSAPTTSAAARAASATDYESIFSGENASLSGSGWKSCPAPVQWTVDTRALTESEAAAQIANLDWAFQQWSTVSGLAFQYAGEEDVTYDDDAFTVEPEDGAEVESRHVYLDFVRDDDSARLGGGTVGLGSPSQVMPTTKEIISGEAVFRADHVKSASTKELKSLYLHELGHVLGLAHARVTANIMYPVVTDKVQLGAGDVNGIHAMTQPCTPES